MLKLCFDDISEWELPSTVLNNFHENVFINSFSLQFFIGNGMTHAKKSEIMAVTKSEKSKQHKWTQDGESIETMSGSYITELVKLVSKTYIFGQLTDFSRGS